MISTIQYDNAPDSIESVWQLYTYDVCGNAKDGYEINNTFKFHQCTIELSKTVHNEGTEYRFIQYELTDKQVKKAFGLHGNSKVTDPYQDENYVFIYRDSDGYPLGEMDLINLSGLTLTPTCGITIDDKDVNLANMEYIK